jgi:NADH-quinone oxidoreductase subunit N
VIFYLVAYVATTLGAFTVASWVGRKGDECQNVDDWAGLARSRPAIALVMTLFMLSLGGFPPTGGFFAKFYLFRAAVERPELVWLVVAAVLNSLVSVYYYLRLVQRGFHGLFQPRKLPYQCAKRALDCHGITGLACFL